MGGGPGAGRRGHGRDAAARSGAEHTRASPNHRDRRRAAAVTNPERQAGTGRMLSDLLAASHLMPLEALPARAAEYGVAAGFTGVQLYLGDLQRRVMRLVSGEQVTGDGSERALSIEATVAGRAYQSGDIVRAHEAGTPPGGGHTFWVPVIDGTERLGLLHITSEYDDEQAMEDMDRLAALVALIIVSKRDSSDALARIVRSHPLNVAAEMQWHLTPPRSYADGRVVIAATMEPAYEISGDAFDYATDGPWVHLAVFDAMGHDTAAGLTANLAVSASRNARRQGADLIGIGETVERTLIEQYDYRRYATGVLARLDTRTGDLTWVNRGHPPPVIIRGSRSGLLLDCPPLHPMGTGLGLHNPPCTRQLEPGDRIVLYTDGITEARRRDGTQFGIERFTDFIIRHHADGLPVPETLRRLIAAVLDHHGGVLQDDATVLLCEWLGPTTTTLTEAASLTGLDESLPRTPPGAANVAASTPAADERASGSADPADPADPADSADAEGPDAATELHITTEVARGRLAVVAVDGELDVSTAGELFRHASGVLEAYRKVVVDLAGVSFCDSSGYNVLLRLRRRATGAGGHLVLADPTETVRRLLAVTGGEDVFLVYPGRAEALRAYTEGGA